MTAVSVREHALPADGGGARSVGIVGGGILGLTAAYRLLQQGVHVALYERSRDLGGLVGAFDFDGYPVDRFYHVVLPADDRVRGLADEVGLGDRFRFRPTSVGFYDDGRLFSMTSPREFLTFPLLAPHERLRLAAFVARCQLPGGHERLDDLPLEQWLRRLCGRNAVRRLWAPLLDSKFDGRYADLPATYIWARTRRMSRTRDGSGRELMGWLHGGYQTLVDRLEARIRDLGGEIHAGTVVDSIAEEAGNPVGLVVDGRIRRFGSVLCTLAPPLARTLLPDPLAARIAPDRCRYIGVVCVVLRLRRSLSPYYHLNITDRRVPLTTVVETTHVVDPDAVGGHLVYAAKYLDSKHADFDRPPDELERDYVGHVRRIFPDLTDDDVLGAVVQRARVTEPVHVLGGAKNLPEMFPMPGLALASTTHVYPEIVSGQAVIGVADRAVAGLLERLPAAEKVTA
jgi:protoporphyrinogen oxidase